MNTGRREFLVKWKVLDNLINTIKGTGYIAKDDTWETEKALSPYMAQISTFLKSEKDETVETASIFRNQPVEMVIDLCSSDEEVKLEKKARPTLKKLKKVTIPSKKISAKRIKENEDISDMEGMDVEEEEEEIVIKPPTKRVKTSMLRLLTSH
jgi:hypothetical protein